MQLEKMHAIDHEDGRLRHAQSAVTFARDRNLEREAVVDERALMRDALKRSMGHASFAEVRNHFEERVGKGDLIELILPTAAPRAASGGSARRSASPTAKG